MIKQGTDVLKEHKSKRLTFDAKLKQINFLNSRMYKRAENKYYPSVTTILQYMPKNRFFQTWLKDVGHNSDIIMRKAGKEGTQVHEASEKLVLGETVEWLDQYGKAKYSELVWSMILKFADFWNETKPELISTEDFVFSDEHLYAGTADLVVKIDGETWLLDIKTSNALHKSYDLQLAAYAKAIEEQKGIKIDRTGIIWLKASTRKTSAKDGVMQGKGWQVKVIDNIDENFRLFKLIYELYSLENKDVIPKYKTYPTSIKL
tara:strand:- start:5452 stop:6234 length:783 start_codon:yes stop_codon:yes gene_type:complete